MRVLPVVLGLLTLGIAVGQASAQSIEQTQHVWRRPLYQRDPGCYAPASGPVTVMPIDPKDKKDPVVDPEAFRQAPSAGSSAGLTFNPGMFGDLAASGNTTVIVRGGSRSTPTAQAFRVPVVGRGAYKISDSESPRPTNRVYFMYNYYDRVGTGDNTFSLSRETIGFETTFLDGDASFGMRLPFLQSSGGGAISNFLTNDIGDLSLIFKYAFINDRETGDVLSGGLTLVVPTAVDGIPLSDGSEMRTVLIQPYAGWIVNMGSWFAQGFHSVVIPTDRRDVTSLNNDVAIGYAFRTNPDRFIRAVVPTIEGHVYTPLDHRGETEQIQAFDIVTMTAGINFVMPRGSVLGAAIAVPVTGPRPNAVEGIVTFNFRF